MKIFKKIFLNLIVLAIIILLVVTAIVGQENVRILYRITLTLYEYGGMSVVIIPILLTISIGLLALTIMMAANFFKKTQLIDIIISALFAVISITIFCWEIIELTYFNLYYGQIIINIGWVMFGLSSIGMSYTLVSEMLISIKPSVKQNDMITFRNAKRNATILLHLKKLCDDGLISNEEFEEKRKYYIDLV